MSKIDSIQTIRSLLSIMTAEEISSLKRVITVRNKHSKSLRLVELLLSKNHYSDIAIREKVSTLGASSAFFNLLGSLKKRILETLGRDFNIDRKELYSEQKRIRFWARKRLNSADILFSRGLKKEALILYDQIIAKCEELEVYDVLIEALIFKRNILAIRQGKIALKEIQSKIEFYQKAKDSYEKARFHFYWLAANVNQRGLPVDQSTIIEPVVKKLQNEYCTHHSKSQYYYLRLLELYVLEQKEQFESAIELLMILKQVVQNSPAIKAKPKLARIELSLAENQLFLNNPKAAADHAHESLSNYRHGLFNQLIAGDIAFLANFHAGQFTEAEKIVLFTTSEQNSITNSFYHARRHYFAAAIHFLRNRNRKAHLNLLQTKSLDGDKNGWNIAVRILSIMNQVNWGGLYNNADAHIDNLYQHINKTKKLKPISKRHLLILDVLKRLVKEGFDFKITAEIEKERLAQLSADKEWNMTCPELIRFDAWFKSKVDAVNYRYDLIYN